MRKSPIRYGVVTLGILLFSSFQGSAPKANTVFVDSQIERAKQELERTRQLVENGTLARVKLREAETALADAEDEGVLARTLYSSQPVEKMTVTQGDDMVAAAQRRVDREGLLVEQRKTLVENGAIAPADFEHLTAILETREQVLVLAKNRRKLLDDLQQMAETERRMQQSLATRGTLQNSMIRFDGNGAFALADLPTLQGQFEKRFHHQLPISALGQTMLHQSIGLDHRNRVDVAINPLSTEGQWLRALLERLHVPYLAFSNAVAGAATAPHIHIGIGSTRLRKR